MAKIDDDRVRRIDDLVRQLQQSFDNDTRAIAHSLVESILELHGSGIERMLDIVFESGDSGKAAIRRLAADGLVSSLLVLHGLHPDDMETRCQHALGKMHGNAELLGVFEGVVRVRLLSSGCGVKEAVETALREAVPDAVDFVIEDSLPLNNFVPLAALGRSTPGMA